MKKSRKIFLIFVSIVIIAVTAIRFAVPALFFNYIYPFDRIKGTVSLTVDGKDIPLSECEVTCTHRDQEEKLHVNGSKIKNRAGEYGRYVYTVKYDSAEFSFYIYQANCWNCQDFDISFSINTTKNTIICKGWCRCLNYNGLKGKKQNIYQDLNLNDIGQFGIWIDGP